jgi:alkylation response protein AidB-like acyl-CoA dehydrogenase
MSVLAELKEPRDGVQIAPPTVASIVASKLRPLARQIDEDGLYPASIMHELGAAGAYAHTARGDIPAAVEAMAEVGAVCGSTSFSMWCQNALVWYLANSENPAPRERYLDDAASGRLLGGTGLSNPMKALAGIERLALKGERVEGGYRITGRLPFVSNIENDHLFAGIFNIEGSDKLGMAVFLAGHNGVTLAQNAHFIALEGTATYSVLMRDVFVPDADVLSHDAVPFVAKIRKGFVLSQCGFGLGVARGAARNMRDDSFGREAAAHLPLQPDTIDARAAALAEQIRALSEGPRETTRAQFLEVLKVRLATSWLALEAAQVAMLQFGARGYLIGSEPSRRLREAQFVATVTPSVKHISAELAKG